uniref:hypothetical protein 59 n=1 Tax=Moniliophthora perniciosa TaxID=153609 RepID=UPI000024235C|nr:hypothetical protein 59 [Moniliophthora perniciosa]AAQ74349.1 hypothetical protein 59 [Moniliophthora perniciosa]
MLRKHRRRKRRKKSAGHFLAVKIRAGRAACSCYALLFLRSRKKQIQGKYQAERSRKQREGRLRAGSREQALSYQRGGKGREEKKQQSDKES